MTQTTFTKEKIAVNEKISDLFLKEMDLSIAKNGDDFVRELFTIQLESFIMTRLNEKQNIIVYRERPTFMEWILRKRRSFVFEISCKEVLKNPPSLPNGSSSILYSVQEL